MVDHLEQRTPTAAAVQAAEQLQIAAGVDVEQHETACVVALEPLELDEDIDNVQTLLRKHIEATGSERAQWVLENWHTLQSKFVKVFPRDFKRVIEARKQAAALPAERATATQVPV